MILRCFLDLLNMLKQNCMVPGHHLADFVKSLLLLILCPNPKYTNFLSLTFFNHLKVFSRTHHLVDIGKSSFLLIIMNFWSYLNPQSCVSRPIWHAEEETYWKPNPSNLKRSFYFSLHSFNIFFLNQTISQVSYFHIWTREILLILYTS
jgi:hypothetical protein